MTIQSVHSSYIVTTTLLITEAHSLYLIQPFQAFRRQAVDD